MSNFIKLVKTIEFQIFRFAADLHRYFSRALKRFKG